jgi:hypothetical protein
MKLDLDIKNEFGFWIKEFFNFIKINFVKFINNLITFIVNKRFLKIPF